MDDLHKFIRNIRVYGMKLVHFLIHTKLNRTIIEPLSKTRFCFPA